MADPDAAAVDKVAVLGAITLIEEYFKPDLRRLYPRMLRQAHTDFDRCRHAIRQVLSRHGLKYRELRQKIGGNSVAGSSGMCFKTCWMPVKSKAATGPTSMS